VAALAPSSSLRRVRERSLTASPELSSARALLGAFVQQPAKAGHEPVEFGTRPAQLSEEGHRLFPREARRLPWGEHRDGPPQPLQVLGCRHRLTRLPNLCSYNKTGRGALPEVAGDAPGVVCLLRSTSE
jgi:hypothetical protein